MEFIDGTLVLTPKPVIPLETVPISQEKYNIASLIDVTESELSALNITHSKIVECVIKKGEEIISTNKKHYRQVVVDLWKTMMPQKILQTTTFNFKLTNENNENGYAWCPDINMSFQSKDAKGTLKEIVQMVKVNKYAIKLVIQLKTKTGDIGEIYNFTME